MKPHNSYPPGVEPLSRRDSAALLDEILAMAKQMGRDGIVAFDLDSTLLDNRPRQAKILREYGLEQQLEALASHEADHWAGWDARIAMRNGGLSEELIEVHYQPFREYWWNKFFTSDYCACDRPLPGAVDFVDAVTRAGARVFYVTGRHEAMRRGTVECFDNCGFSSPKQPHIELIMKPTMDEHDDTFKLRTYAQLRQAGNVIAAFDNEPAHINGYAEAFPQARCVHLATDYSMRDIPLAAGIPSIIDFQR